MDFNNLKRNFDEQPREPESIAVGENYSGTWRQKGNLTTK